MRRDLRDTIYALLNNADVHFGDQIATAQELLPPTPCSAPYGMLREGRFAVGSSTCSRRFLPLRYAPWTRRSP